MPKELTHFLLAQNLRENLPGTSLFYKAVTRYPCLFLYGSVMPDTGFYYMLGPGRVAIQDVSKQLHGYDATCLVPLIRFLNKSSSNEPDVLALSAGVCCHIIADTVFHPMVYYFAGADSRHPGATFRHRLFETALDFHLGACRSSRQILTLPRVLGGIKISRRRLAGLLCMFQEKPHVSSLLWCLAALEYHGIAHQMFCNYKVYLQMCRLQNLVPGVSREFLALFQPEEKHRALAFFSQPVEYKDPLTGTQYRHHPDLLFQKVTMDTIHLLGQIEKMMEKKGELQKIIPDLEMPKIAPCPSSRPGDYINCYAKADLKVRLYGLPKNRGLNTL